MIPEHDCGAIPLPWRWPWQPDPRRQHGHCPKCGIFLTTRRPIYAGELAVTTSASDRPFRLDPPPSQEGIIPSKSQFHATKTLGDPQMAKRNPQDSTRRNDQASKKRDEALMDRIRRVETRVAKLEASAKRKAAKRR